MEVTIYSAFWCPDCREAKRFLREHNIPFKEIDIETTPGAAEEVVKHTGLRAIPQFVINGEWVQPSALARVFSIKKWPSAWELLNCKQLGQIQPDRTSPFVP